MPLGTIEKDLAITCVLHSLSGSWLSEHLVFKGGTAIKKVYQPDARFSEDVDFTVRSLGGRDVTAAMQQLFPGRRVEAVQFGELLEEGSSRGGRRLRLSFLGPLRYRNSVRIDLSFRDDLIMETRRMATVHRYGDAVPSDLHVLDFSEIMAEKLRALMERGYARDYYDVWSHIDRIQDKDVLRDLVKRKCAMADVEYAPGTIFEDGILRLVETSWKVQLQHLLPAQVDFAAVISSLETKLGFM